MFGLSLRVFGTAWVLVLSQLSSASVQGQTSTVKSGFETIIELPLGTLDCSNAEQNVMRGKIVAAINKSGHLNFEPDDIDPEEINRLINGEQILYRAKENGHAIRKPVACKATVPQRPAYAPDCHASGRSCG